MRVVVENVNDKLKKWRVLSTKYRHYTTSSKKKNPLPLDLVVDVVARLTNKVIKQTPLRKEGWEPKAKHVNNLVDLATLLAEEPYLDESEDEIDPHTL